MSWLTGVQARLGGLFRRGAAESRLEEEIRFHLEMEASRLETAGLSPEEARRRAALAFGGVEKWREEVRDGRGLPWLESVLADARHALRGLRRRPGYALAAVLTLALGTGATTAIFAAVHAVLLAPLPYPEPGRLVRVYIENSTTNRWGPSAVGWRAIDAEQRSFEAAGAVRFGEVGLVTPRGPQRVRAGAATSGFFGALAVTPEAGRVLLAGDDDPGAPAVAVLSHALALRAFDDAGAALGRPVTLDGVSHRVVGVLPAGARDLAGVRADVWPALRVPEPRRRGPFGLYIVARLRDGATLASARRDLVGISERLFPLWASSFQDRTARFTAVPLGDAIVGGRAGPLWLFAAAVALVLVIALANVAGLVLVRATGRTREWALRAALGAPRRRLARQLLTESVVLTATGAAVGVALAAALLRVLPALGPDIPRLDAAALDPAAFAFAAGLALLAGLAVAAWPFASLLRREPAGELRGGDRQVGSGRSAGSARGVLVTLELALALPLLIGAALLVTSFLRLQRVDPGFDPRRVLTVSIALPSARYPEDADVAGFWRRALLRLGGVRGVVAAGVSDAVPPDMPWNENNFDLLDRPVPAGAAQPVVPWLTVSPAVFDALGVKLLDGRTLAPADSAGAPPVVVVSRAWERRYSPDRGAVGRRLVSGGCTECPPTTVVGVVGDVKYGGLDGTGVAAYQPLSQAPPRDATLLVRTAGAPAELAGAVRRSLQALDPAIPLETSTLERRVEASVAAPRSWATLLAAFAATALGLSALGIFGLLSYLVAARRREIGVRVALGAGRGEVVRMIVRRGMRQAATGAAIGVVVALLGARWLRGALYGIGPRDPLTLAAATAALLAVALLASWIPARRAAAVDPLEVMRSE